MPRKYAELTFTDSVKQVQKRYGARRQTAKMEAVDWPDERLTDREVGFISERDSFYVASVGENRARLSFRLVKGQQRSMLTNRHPLRGARQPVAILDNVAANTAWLYSHAKSRQRFVPDRKVRFERRNLLDNRFREFADRHGALH